MLTIKQTGLEELSFGDQPDDIFIVLVNKLISPNGIDLEKLRLVDPRHFDTALDQAGCIFMLNNIEIEELTRRGEIDKNDLHTSLFELAKAEGMLP